MSERLTTPLDDFKDRELEILNMMAQGLSNQDIADQLFITKGTVRWYNKQIYSKLGTSRRTEAIALARDMGLINDGQTDSATNDAIKHKLPITTGPFIGRDQELAELTDLLNKPDIRLLSVIAAGGMGKSRLSLELGHLIKDNYQHGVVFIDLTPIRNPDDIAKSAITSLGLNVTGDETPEETLFNYCREKELLLIFDNFEHVLSGASLLSDILEVAPNVTIIATSRERLNLRVETVFYLEPVTQNGDQLFIEVASMMRPSIVIDKREITDIQRIVEFVGGLPLGLILAATWVDTLSIPEIADEIRISLDFLSAEMGDMPERQRSIHAVVDPTWKRLSDKEQQAFMWASVFRGGFTREIFKQVTGASIRTLQILLNRSLITHGHKRRYEMHPLLRQYAREKLESANTLNEAKKAHLYTFRDYAEHHKQRQFEGQYLETLEAFEVEQDNFRAGLDWSFSGYEVEAGVALTLSLADFWIDRSQISEAIYYFEWALKHQQVAQLYSQLGFCQNRMGRVDHAENSLRKAISLAQESQSSDVLANSYRILADVYEHNKPTHEIQNLFEKAFEYVQVSESPRTIAAYHVSFGLLLRNTNTPASEVLEHCQIALNIYENIGDLQGISRTIYNMALEYDRIGAQKRARKLVERSLALKHQIGDKAGAARRLNVLANWDFLDEEFEHAQSYLAESIAIAEELGEQSRLQYALMSQGFLLMVMGEYNDSIKSLEDSLRLATAIENYQRIENCSGILGMLYLIQGKSKQAFPYIQRAIETSRDTHINPWMSITAYASYLWHQGNYTACVPIVAVLFNEIESTERDYSFNNKYFLRPLIYRVQQKIGGQAWQDAVDTAQDSTIKQVFQDIVTAL